MNTTPESLNHDIIQRFEAIKAQLLSALERAPNWPSPRILIASKEQPATHCEALLAYGHRLFGENRVQEAASKWPQLCRIYPDTELHLIGPLQSNKAAEAVALFNVIESVDRPKIAVAIANECARQGREVACLIQINTGEEPQKAGIMPREADDFIRWCRNDVGLWVTGLMCIPPADQDPAPHFTWLAQKAAAHHLNEVSMGMSGDYVIAAKLGATILRIGSAIFGARAH